jgi:hypothetical protein
MNPALIAALINQLLIPELLEIVRRRQAADQPITDADIIREFNDRVLAIVTEGENWLAAHP